MATMLLTLSLAVQALGEPVQGWLRYDREAVLAGQAWRLLSAHVVHLSWAHMILNAVALALLAALLGKQQRASDWWLATLLSALGTGGGLAAFHPELGWYVGLSGVVHGLFGAGCVALLRRHPTVALLALTALMAKLGWEQAHPPGAAREALVGGAIVLHAHVYGAAGGLLAGACIHLRPLLRAIRRLAGNRHHQHLA